MTATDIAKSVWDDFENERRRQELSHWRGIGKWEDDLKWQGVGANTLKRLHGFQRFLGRDLAEPGSELTMLEWGPGGGSNAYAFRDIAKIYYGVDISEKNITECERMLAEEEAEDILHPLLLSDDPKTIEPRVAIPVDVFLSTAVFQHFPSCDYGLEVLGAIRSVCAPNAIGLIQIRYDNGNEKFRPNESVEDYSKRFIHATSYPIDAFCTHCSDAGFMVHFVSHINPSSQYATFYLQAV